MKLYSVATGNIEPLNTASTEAVRFIKGLPGMVGVYPESERGMLWMFDSLGHAESAKEKMTEKGIVTGKNICKFKMRKDGAAEFISVCMKFNGTEDGIDII